MITVNHECYVSLEVAKLLKEAGFDWEVKAYYSYLSPYDEYNLEFDSTSTNYNHIKNANFSAPTLDVAQRWLREVKGRLVLVGSVPEYFFCTIYEYKRKIDHIFIESDSPFDTYEEAQESGIKKALELILKKGDVI